MYSVQFDWGVPKELPQGSTQDGRHRRHITSISDAPR
jgi:hypothetical protein